jgi:ABC-type dipeptide/oligopeptide/nickel transport system ATPase component
MIKVTNLSVEINSQTIVKNISYSVAKNKMLSVVGESGAGKSLSVKVLLDVLPKNAHAKFESITIDGKIYTDLKQLQALRGAKICLISQDAILAFNPAYSIGAQIMESFIIHQHASKREAKDKTIALLYELNMPDPEVIINYYPRQLSGGMAQRALIGMMLACNPDIIIADEITSSLDSVNKHLILKLLKKYMLAHNKCLIFVTHEIELAEEYADEVIVMRDGEIVDVCTNIAQSSNPYTQLLLHSTTKYLYQEMIANNA